MFDKCLLNEWMKHILGSTNDGSWYQNDEQDKSLPELWFLFINMKQAENILEVLGFYWLMEILLP